MGLLARREDAHCVLYHLLVVAAYLTAFWLWLCPEVAGFDGFWSRAVFVATAAPLLGWISGIDLGVNYHNHTHRPLFRRAWLNRWFERLWTPFCGWPAKYWRHLHVAVHHKHLLGPKDWSTRRRRSSGDYESCLSFQVRHWPWRHGFHLAADIRAGRFRRRTAMVELFWFAVIWSAPFVIDPVMGLCLWLLPHWCGNCITMGRGMFVQHAGREPWLDGKADSHSNDFEATFYNLTMFNIGYHTAHHDLPGVHWTDLPTAARGLASRPRDGDGQDADEVAAQEQ